MHVRGLFAVATSNAASCGLQDFDPAVLELATHVNVALNTRLHAPTGAALDGGAVGAPAFVSGDFASACALLAARPGFRAYDVILTAETIYSPGSAAQLLSGAVACLAPRGIVLLAAKCHYFGVGGSVAAFKQQVAAHGALRVADEIRIVDPQGTARAILQLERTDHVREAVLW